MFGADSLGLSRCSVLSAPILATRGDTMKQEILKKCICDMVSDINNVRLLWVVYAFVGKLVKGGRL